MRQGIGHRFRGCIRILQFWHPWGLGLVSLQFQQLSILKICRFIVFGQFADFILYAGIFG